MANKKRGMMYTGVTGDIIRRAYEHRNHLIGGFTAKYGLDKLVWVDQTEDELGAIGHEKRMKRWHREWKFQLIEKHNPEWIDLYPSLFS